MKKVLFLSSWYPSRVHSTLGNFVSYHVKAVSKTNKVHLLYITADDTIKDYEIHMAPLPNAKQVAMQPIPLSPYDNLRVEFHLWQNIREKNNPAKK